MGADEYFKKRNIEIPVKNVDDAEHHVIHQLNGFNGQNMLNFTDNSRDNFIQHNVEDLYDSDIKFIYPLIIYDNSIFEKYETIDFDIRLVECVKKKQAKILFSYLTEGYFSEDDHELIWLNNLSKRYGFDKEDLIILTSNLIADENKNELIENKIIEDNYTVIGWPYFGNDLWFGEDGSGRLLSDEIKKIHRINFDKFNKLNKTKKKDIHFMCFNRVPRSHRILLFGEIKTNPQLNDKCIITLGFHDDSEKMDFYREARRHLDHSYKHGAQRIFSFLHGYDSTKPTFYDEPDMENNKACTLNMELHSSSFLNIVTETLTNPKSLFFSEKIYKPIYMLQPFILMGNPNSLKMLKKLGFKTFDKWWDESYDDEVDMVKRLEKIVDVLLEISTWDMDKCFQVTQEMEEVLKHNSNRLLENVDYERLYNQLLF
jgi:hypothetical protein